MASSHSPLTFEGICQASLVRDSGDHMSPPQHDRFATGKPSRPRAAPAQAAGSVVFPGPSTITVPFPVESRARLSRSGRGNLPRAVSWQARACTRIVALRDVSKRRPFAVGHRPLGQETRYGSPLAIDRPVLSLPSFCWSPPGPRQFGMSVRPMNGFPYRWGKQPCFSSGGSPAVAPKLYPAI